MALADASPAGSALLMGNYTLLFQKIMPFITCNCFTYVRGCDLVIVTIREWIVGGFGGREEMLFLRNANTKILDAHGIHLLCWGHFTLKIKGW